MKEMGASRTSFPKNNFNKKNCLSTKFLGITYHLKINTNYQKIQNKTLLHREKVGKTQKAQKFKCGRHFRRDLQNFSGVAKICNPCEFGKVASTVLLLLLLLASEALNYNYALHALSSIPTFEICSL